ncbi:hypothetical protein [Nocardia wallacei]|uniref:hypothetical protein n=1 Tax=Nocardia wallacei TaxID=480035 RepID=UPI002454A232|nr:hypothetical protein [Nocardia wallacei]
MVAAARAPAGGASATVSIEFRQRGIDHIFDESVRLGFSQRTARTTPEEFAMIMDLVADFG